jgi:hypothetical protein
VRGALVTSQPEEDNDRVNNPNMATPSRANGVLALIVGIALALLGVSLFINANRETRELSTKTPEGVVQLYLKAIIEGKNDVAAGYFTAQSDCDASDIDRAYISETLRVNLIKSEITGNSAYVKIDANQGSGDLFDSGYTESHTYRLVKESGNWRLQGIPWPLWDCETVTK